MVATSIEWCDFSINPIRARLGDGDGHYCEKISPGCKDKRLRQFPAVAQ